jgi:phosphoribosyl 1,2-cyclic phosphodiesterase
VRAVVWGARGSLASPGPETARYGGQTACIAVHLSDGSLVVLDAGTGIRPLGMALAQEPLDRVDLLITHLHSDHIEGLKFFEPFWDASVEFHVWGPPSPLKPLRDRLAPFFAPPFFPVHLRDVPCRPEFHEVPTDGWQLGSATVFADLIKHPGPAVGYRIEENGHALAYLPDHEPVLGTDLEDSDPQWISGFALSDAADVLIHDAQYTQVEYDSRVGWGHSSTQQVVTFAERADAKRLVLFHHDPLHTDDDLDGILATARDLTRGDRGRIELAHEGMALNVP